MPTPVLKDRVMETSFTQGTGPYTLNGSIPGYQTFAAVGDGSTTYYAATDGIGWEVGEGTYAASARSLSRDTILASSNGGNAVNWLPTPKSVWVDFPASITQIFANGTTGTGEIVLANGAAIDLTNATGLASLASGAGMLPSANGGYAYAATRTDLAAVDHAKNTTTWLGEGLRAGAFQWNPADLSTEVTADTQQGIYVAPPSDPTGASGAWVRQFSGTTYPTWFGAAGDGVTLDTDAVNGALAMPFPVCIDQPMNYLVDGPTSGGLDTQVALRLVSGGARYIFGAGQITAKQTGYALMAGTSLTGLHIDGPTLLGAATIGTATVSTDPLIRLTTCSKTKIENVYGSNALYAGILFAGGDHATVKDCQLDYCALPILAEGLVNFKFDRVNTEGGIGTLATFKTGIQLAGTQSSTYGVCEDGVISNCVTKGLGNAQSMLAHAGINILFKGNSSYGCAMGIAAGANVDADTITNIRMVDNFSDCDVPDLTSAEIAAAYGFRVSGSSASNLAERCLVRGNIGINVNQQLNDAGSGGIYNAYSRNTIVSDNIVQDSYGAGCLDVQGNINLTYRGNTIMTISGTSGSKGWGYRFQGLGSAPSVNTRVEGGTVQDVATAFRNESANAAGTVYIDPSISIVSATTTQSGFGTGFGPQALVVTSGTSIDLTNVDKVIFAATAAHSISAITNAVPGKLYTFEFTNANTTISHTANNILTSGGANIVGANHMVTQFIAIAQTEIQQVAASSSNS